jgi:hypothetical protein
MAVPNGLLDKGKRIDSVPAPLHPSPHAGREREGHRIR